MLILKNTNLDPWIGRWGRVANRRPLVNGIVCRGVTIADCDSAGRISLFRGCCVRQGNGGKRSIICLAGAVHTNYTWMKSTFRFYGQRREVGFGGGFLASSSIADDEASVWCESMTEVNTPNDPSRSSEWVSGLSADFRRLRITNITLLQRMDSIVCWNLMEWWTVS